MSADDERQRLLDRFRVAALAANLGTWSWDLESDRFEIDGNVERLLGRPRLGFRGTLDDFMRLLPEAARASWHEVAMAARIGDALLFLEFPIQWPDGSLRNLMARGTVLADADGHPRSGVGAIWDASDLFEARARAEEHARVLHAVLDAMPSAVIATDKAGRITVYNRAAEALTGVAAREVPTDPSRWPAVYGVHASDGRPLALEEIPLTRALQGESVRDTELLVRNRERPAGIFVVANAQPLRDTDGEQTGAVAVFTDITERHRAQDALARSEARFREMANSAPEIMWTALGNGEIEFVNRPGVRYFGRPLEELQGRGWMFAVHPDDVQNLLDVWGGHIANGTPVEVQYRLRRHDGEYRWHLARGNPEVDAQGQARYWHGTLTDIEDLRRAQDAAEAATRAKSAFLSSMSHEIRTPMNAIIGMTSILMDSKLTPEQREAAEVIRSSGEHLMTVINDILDYSKIEAGKLDLENTPFSLRECVEGALDLVSTSAAGRRVELGYLMHESTPEAVRGDVGRLRQVLLNLLSNAVKFTPSGGQVMVEVRAASDTGTRRTVEFSVQDTGVGMNADTLAQLFQPFTQADASTTRRFGGTGLGLSISKRLVELMGGDIRAASTPGQGSRFTFHIVVETVYRPGAALASAPLLRGRRVLIVDDIDINRRILAHYISAWGMVPQLVASPREALDRVARGEAFDVALLDYHMPDLDGAALAQGLRALRSAAQLPILILSSESIDAAFATDVDGTMLKPIKPARLHDALIRLFDNEQRRGAIESAAADLPTAAFAAEHPLRLLVVEDNPVNQRVARLLLEKMGYSADFAGNGAEGLEAVARQTYDLVLMDVQMPVMDGLAATREICRRYPAAQRPRIVGLTANATEDDRRDCEQAGMDDYLAKPVRPDTLARVLRGTTRRVDEPCRDDFSAAGLAEMRRVYEDEGAAEIVAAMAQDLPTQGSALERAAAERDVRTLKRAAHSVKSAARMVGADALGNLWENIERLSVDATLDQAIALIPEALTRQQVLLARLCRELGIERGVEPGVDSSTV